MNFGEVLAEVHFVFSEHFPFFKNSGAPQQIHIPRTYEERTLLNHGSQLPGNPMPQVKHQNNNFGNQGNGNNIGKQGFGVNNNMQQNQSLDQGTEKKAKED